jgi:hypothetical protein
MKIGHFAVTDVESITAAMDKINEKYKDKEVSWDRALDQAIETAREAKKAVVVLFGDEKEETTDTVKAFDHKSIAKNHDKLVFVRLAYDREGADAKRLGVMQCPMVVMIDPSKVEGEDLKKGIVGELAGKQKQPALRAMVTRGLDKMKAASAK